MDEKKISIMCRVCLKCDLAKSNKCQSIFEQFDKSLVFTKLLIAEKINTIANVNICEGDGLPEKICSGCLVELEKALHFKIKCENSNAILRNTEVYIANEDPQTLLEIKKEETIEFEYKPHFLEVDHQSQEFEEAPEKARKSKAIDLKLECHDCGGFFKSKCKLRVHWKKSHKPKLMCELCKRVFKSYKAYHLHNKYRKKSCKACANFQIEGEGKTRIFHCKECEYKTKRLKDINVHFLIHSGDRPFKCDKCMRCFTQQSSLQTHKEVTHSDYKVETTCQYCGKYIKGRYKLNIHMRIHRVKTDKFQCDICKKYLNSKGTLITHMHRHSGTRLFTCEICAKTCYSSSELCNHKRWSHQLKSKNFKCGICGYEAYRPEVIKRHKSKHTATNHACLTCGMFLENQELLGLHMKRHLEKPYACPQCEKKFYGRTSLSRHVSKKHKCTMLINGLKPARVKKEIKNDLHYDNGIKIVASNMPPNN